MLRCWRKVCLCACTVCGCFFVLFIGIAILVCLRMSDKPPEILMENNVHFTAPGASEDRTPSSFWQSSKHTNGYWNHLQQLVDYHFNPVLNPTSNFLQFQHSTFYAYLLKKSFFDVPKFTSMAYLNGQPRLLQDFSDHMDKRDYPIVLQPRGMCGVGAKDEAGPPLLLLAIKTTELNFKARQAIRNTWGQAGWVSGLSHSLYEDGGGYIRRVFLLGKENFEEVGVSTSHIIQKESEVYGDILQWDFMDTFFNLTLKDVLFWKWYSSSCSSVFVFKGDDDIFVHISRMVAYLQEQLRRPDAEEMMKTFMTGYVLSSTSPIRDYDSKYFIPDNFYLGTYPAYPSGGGVIYSGQLTKRLYQVSQRVHLYPIDDAYVGMCMVRLNAFPIHHPAFVLFELSASDLEDECAFHKVLVLHRRTPTQLYTLWKNLKLNQAKCWNAPIRQSTGSLNEYSHMMKNMPRTTTADSGPESDSLPRGPSSWLFPELGL